MRFSDEAIDRIAEMAQRVNEDSENIGARRLHTIMEYLLEEISFDAPDTEMSDVRIDACDVEQRLAGLAENQDLSTVHSIRSRTPKGHGPRTTTRDSIPFA